MTFRIRCALAALIAALAAFAAVAAPPGKILASTAVPNSQGRILVAGQDDSSLPYKIIVGRLNADGTADSGSNFGTAGWVVRTLDPAITQLQVLGMASNYDGQSVVLMRANGRAALLRLGASGEAVAFGTPEGFLLDDESAAYERANAVVLRGDGSVVTAGSYAGPATGGDRHLQLVHYTSLGRNLAWGNGPAGSHIHSMTAGANEANAAVELAGGSIVVAGHGHNGTNSDFLVARFLANGQNDPGFNYGQAVLIDNFGDDTAYAIGVDSQGRVVVGGRNGHGNGQMSHFVVARRLADGSPDYSFGNGGGITTFVRDPYWSILDATLTSIAFVPSTDAVIAAGTALDRWTGDVSFAVANFGIYQDPLTAPHTTDADTLRGVYANADGFIVAVGSRNSGGADSLLTVRYLAEPLLFDTENPGTDPDSVPNTFSFNGTSGVGPGGYAVTSAPAWITGINVPVSISVTGGEYAIDCNYEGWTTAPGTISNGDPVCVRHNAATTPNTSITTTLTVGGVQATYTSTTGGPPNAYLTQVPPSPSGATVEFRKDPWYAECSLDAAPFSACNGSSVWLNSLANGSHTFRVRASNAWGYGNTASHTWEVYVPPPPPPVPNTTITSSPPAVTNSGDASFSFTATDPAATFECKLDAGIWVTSCTSPWRYNYLSSGSHTFQVRARNSQGTDATPATYTWTIDFTAPDATITQGPASLTTSTTATFAFSSSDPTATFRCKLGYDSEFSPCTSPITYTGLSEGWHAFQLEARDAAGNYVWRNWEWTVDTLPPDTTWAWTPPAYTNSTTASFGINSSGSAARYDCRLDGGTVHTCPWPTTYSGLAAGTHTLEVTAVDAAGNADPTPSTWTWTIDLTAPMATITGGPSGTSGSATATFAFEANEPAQAFECRLDGGALTPCTSPVTYTGLADGPHSFSVQARDLAGNQGGPSPTRSWIVDTVAPESTLTSAPSGVVGSNSAALQFAANESGAAFECRLDGAAFAACSSPVALSGLAEGAHTFEVRAVDAAGNTDATPATASWTVDTTVPDTTITAAPSGTVSQSTATLQFTSSEPAATFECSVDGAPYAACSSPLTITGFADGAHGFAVRARDAAGHVDATPATASWTVDTTAPDTALTGGPSGTTAESSASFTFTSEGGAGFECRLDGAAFAACASPANFSSLADGTHTFEVRAKDAVGNVDPTPASRTWVVDTTAPDTTINSGPPAASAQSSATFAFTGALPGDTYQCSLDGAAFSACTSPVSYAGLANGSHIFRVRAVDAAGNADASPATWTWVIDTLPPDTTLTGGPSGNVDSSTATFTFTSSEGGADFECQLDGGTFTACASPVTYTGLAKGNHTFSVRARDAAGNVDPTPATRSWRVR